MSHLKKIIFLLSVTFISISGSAQVWERIQGLPFIPYTAIEVIDETLYAVSGKNLYTSSDLGSTWTHSFISDQEGLWVSCLKKFNGRIYAGTSIGIFSVNIDAATNFWNLDHASAQVNSFTEKDGTLYASTEVTGILRYNGPGASWTPFNTGLPTYSMSVTEVLSTPAGLLAVAGSNGTFYRYSLLQNKWIEDYYSNQGLVAGIDVDDLLAVGNTLYASRYNTIYRSDDLGQNWTEDKIGLVSGQTRFLYLAGNTMYSISMLGADMTRLQQRSTSSPATSWSPGTQELPFLTYAMRELHGVLFLASSQGIYRNGDALDVPEAVKIATAVVPNPSNGEFMCISEADISSVKVFDLSGRLVFAQEGSEGIGKVRVSQKGIYLVEMYSGGVRSIHKLIVH